MKYIKLFEELNLENVKKYPYLFNMFVDPIHIKKEDYWEVDDWLKDHQDKNVKKTYHLR